MAERAAGEEREDGEMEAGGGGEGIREESCTEATSCSRRLLRVASARADAEGELP